MKLTPPIQLYKPRYIPNKYFEFERETYFAHNLMSKSVCKGASLSHRY